jgi:hypothetical protein
MVPKHPVSRRVALATRLAALPAAAAMVMGPSAAITNGVEAEASLPEGTSTSQIVRTDSFKAATTPKYREVAVGYNANLAKTIRASDAKIVFVEDIHSVPEIRQAMLNHEFAEKLAQMGFTHYVIEGAARPVLLKALDGLNSGEGGSIAERNDIAPAASYDQTFGKVAMRMHRAGLELVAGDHPGNSPASRDYPGVAEREKFIRETIDQTAKDGGRVLALFGRLHAELKPISPGVPSAAQQLVEQGHTVLSVRVTNGL